MNPNKRAPSPFFIPPTQRVKTVEASSSSSITKTQGISLLIDKATNTESAKPGISTSHKGVDLTIKKIRKCFLDLLMEISNHDCCSTISVEGCPVRFDYHAMEEIFEYAIGMIMSMSRISNGAAMMDNSHEVNIKAVENGLKNFNGEKEIRHWINWVCSPSRNQQ